MENIFEIKPEFKTAVVGFNNSGLPLGKRSDLHLLAEMAQYSPGLRKYFVAVPTMEQINDYKAARFMAAIANTTVENNTEKTNNSTLPGEKVTQTMALVPMPKAVRGFKAKKNKNI